MLEFEENIFWYSIFWESTIKLMTFYDKSGDFIGILGKTTLLTEFRFWGGFEPSSLAHKPTVDFAVDCSHWLFFHLFLVTSFNL